MQSGSLAAASLSPPVLLGGGRWVVGGGLQMDLGRFYHTLWEVLSRGDNFKVSAAILYLRRQFCLYLLLLLPLFFLLLPGLHQKHNKGRLIYSFSRVCIESMQCEKHCFPCLSLVSSSWQQQRQLWNSSNFLMPTEYFLLLAIHKTTELIKNNTIKILSFAQPMLIYSP